MLGRILQRTIILITFVLALILAVMPMSLAIAPWRPEWPLLVLVYWIIALPHRVNIGYAAGVGLAVDVLLGSTLGFHTAAYAIVAYPAARYYSRIRNFSLSQQALLVMVLVFVARAIVYIFEHYLNNAPLMWHYFWPALSSALFWPWVFLMLRKVRRKFLVR
ncbi:rod shape-determining protein MreD [Aliidiomarina haloalkalitolerans]|uniref:Rod shape-determining protein MreD n=1 Tax=Aliidiomarina haloalkalitolerans TaxID=859059 RepID=A0A432VSR8_9GAMM|nr:rod shape-determining protein MreD [Aliidiomarina haloalkalitolerans]RUO19437.1 rod shape-determining protein MreD [Aliidiomarina haloalkalitolerans]